jgi:hypothetical protein
MTETAWTALLEDALRHLQETCNLTECLAGAPRMPRQMASRVMQGVFGGEAA